MEPVYSAERKNPSTFWYFVLSASWNLHSADQNLAHFDILCFEGDVCLKRRWDYENDWTWVTALKLVKNEKEENEKH